MQVDPSSNRYPYCLVWTALPCITCCLPFIGHTGICKSDGTIYDFVGKGPMHHGELAFGAPLKYLVLEHSTISSEEWDDAVTKANCTFSKRNHNLITNNCHHHVAEVLNNLRYGGRDNWGQVDIALLALKGTHTGYIIEYLAYAPTGYMPYL